MAIFFRLYGFRLSGVLFLGVLGFCIVLSGRWLLADVNHYGVIPLMDGWGEKGAVASLGEWESVRDTLALSQRLDAGEADYYRLAGLAYDWRGFAIAGEEVLAADLIASRKDALMAYREMAQHRPADPAGWAHLARMKIMTGERDDEFRMALRNAVRFGGNRSAILAEVAYTVSLAWNAVGSDAALKALVLEALAGQLERGRDVNGVLDNLQGSVVLGEVCAGVDVELVGERVLGACGF